MQMQHRSYSMMRRKQMSTRGEKLYFLLILLILSAGFMVYMSSGILKRLGTVEYRYVRNFVREDEESVHHHFCIGDSQHDTCCNPKQCELIRQSNLLSTCCNNLVTLGSENNNNLSKVYPLLITATPRSGTVFMANFLNNFGLELGKDSIVGADLNNPEKHGRVSWVHVFNDSLYDPFPTALKYLYGSKFEVVWHQLRDPLKALTSIVFTEPLGDKKFLDYLQRHISLSGDTTTTFATKEKSEELTPIRIRRGLEFYIQWHTFIDSLRLPMFRLEDIVENKNMTILDQILHSINEPIPDHHKVIRLINENDTKTNPREHREVLKWEELCQVDVDLTKQFWDMSRSYGYYHDLVDDGLCILD